MMSFSNLPAEIRQQIIAEALPPQLHMTRLCPEPIGPFLLVSQQFNEDMKQVLPNWRPIHYFPRPTPTYRRCRLIPESHTIIVSVFHDSETEIINCTAYAYFLQSNHFELIESWRDGASSLPKHVTNINFDATPAPGWLRHDHPEQVNSFINDRRATNFFLPTHVAVLGEMISSFATHYGDRVNFELSGDFGKKSETSISWLMEFCREEGVEINFTGRYLEPVSELLPSVIDARNGEVVEATV